MLQTQQRALTNPTGSGPKWFCRGAPSLSEGLGFYTPLLISYCMWPTSGKRLAQQGSFYPERQSSKRAGSGELSLVTFPAPGARPSFQKETQGARCSTHTRSILRQGFFIYIFIYLVVSGLSYGKGDLLCSSWTLQSWRAQQLLCVGLAAHWTTKEILRQEVFIHRSRQANHPRSEHPPCSQSECLQE